MRALPSPPVQTSRNPIPNDRYHLTIITTITTFWSACLLLPVWPPIPSAVSSSFCLSSTFSNKTINQSRTAWKLFTEVKNMDEIVKAVLTLTCLKTLSPLDLCQSQYWTWDTKITKIHWWWNKGHAPWHLCWCQQHPPQREVPLPLLQPNRLHHIEGGALPAWEEFNIRNSNTIFVINQNIGQMWLWAVLHWSYKYRIMSQELNFRSIESVEL